MSALLSTDMNSEEESIKSESQDLTTLHWQISVLILDQVVEHHAS